MWGKSCPSCTGVVLEECWGWGPAAGSLVVTEEPCEVTWGAVEWCYMGCTPYGVTATSPKAAGHPSFHPQCCWGGWGVINAPCGRWYLWGPAWGG